MGAVYRARDVELDRSVAVKCLLDVSRESARDLALREARTLASLSHPNIMRVFDILNLGDGGEQLWLVCEWLEGRCLAQLPLPLPPAAVLAIMTQVYEALAAAHAAQVIHRDVKPANVMVGNTGRATLIDFGVAFAPGVSTGATLAGSLRYADPRILEGETPDAASDLFSAALLQVELMTGETVLPELAPLPLYRHIKKNLQTRLDVMLDGAYPPLAALARGCTQRFGGAGRNAVVATAAAAAAAARDALRRLTPLSPEQYLAACLAAGTFQDADADEALRQEAQDQLASGGLSPKQKSAWIAFQAGLDTRPAAAPTVGARLARIDSARPSRSTKVQLEHESHARLIAILAVLVLVLAGAVFWMVLKPQSGPTAVPVATRPAAADTPVPLAQVASVAAETPAPAEPVALHLAANAWAVVIVNGKELGRLPQAAPFMLPPGRHTLRLENPSVQTLVTEITLDRGRAHKMHFNLKPKVTPRVVKLATPGRLFVDGVDHGVVTEKTISLPYGTHEIWIKRGQRIVKQQSLALGPDSPKEIALE